MARLGSFIPSTSLLIEDDSPCCPACDSGLFVKKGRRINSLGTSIKQFYLCKDCGYSFRASSNGRYRYMQKFDRDLVDFACDKIEKGMSSKEVQRLIKDKFGAYVSRVSICSWAKRYRGYKFTKQVKAQRESESLNWVKRDITLNYLAEVTDTDYNQINFALSRTTALSKIRKLKDDKSRPEPFAPEERLKVARISYLSRIVEAATKELASLQIANEQTTKIPRDQSVGEERGR